MQLDNTRIAVRERGLLEIFDLALHVTREFAGPWIVCSLLAIVPLAVLNYFLIGWMAHADYDTDAPGARYLWNMTLLVYIEAPLASIFAVAYLGPAVFLEKRTVRQVVVDVIRYTPQLFLCQLVLRGILPVWLMYLAVDRYAFSHWEGWLLPGIALYATVIRALRPYINEIVLLEKNPLFSKKDTVITIAKRSSHLHGPSSADLIVRWVCAAMVATLLAMMALVTATAAIGVLISKWPIGIDMEESEMIWNVDWLELQFVYPICLWLVVAYLSVVRFLSYLDLRIRHEGWEVELLMRAEALRLAAKVG
jgi:hypothetical protein